MKTFKVVRNFWSQKKEYKIGDLYSGDQFESLQSLGLLGECVDPLEEEIGIDDESLGESLPLSPEEEKPKKKKKKG